MEKNEQENIEEMLARMMSRFQGQVVEAFDQRIGILEESFQHKLDLVVEGQQTMVERMDRMEGRMDRVENRLDQVEVKIVSVEKKVDGLEKKVDRIAADLSEHRADTEAHRKGWRVREEE